jgi:hypothetical protein
LKTTGGRADLLRGLPVDGISLRSGEPPEPKGVLPSPRVEAAEPASGGFHPAKV